MLSLRSSLRPARPFLHQQGRALWWVLLLVLIAAAVGGGLWWKQRQAAPAQADAPAGRGGPGGPGGRGPARFSAGGQTQPVSVGVVRRQDVRVQVNAIGTMSARATAVVRAKVSGELTSLRFKEGEEVKAGQLLAEIDPRSYQASLSQVQGNLARDQALLKNAQLDLKRYQDLLAKDSIASQQVDTQAAQVRQLEGTVAADQAQVDAAKLQLSYTRITAPIAGRLGLRQADRGNVVGPSDANGIVTINLVRPIDAVFSVPEAHLAQINQRLGEGAELPVELWDREQKRRLGRGKVGALDNAIDATTGTIKVKATFGNEDGTLFPNQFVNVRLQVNLLQDAVTVPGTAIQNNYVYLVQPDGTVTQRRIRVGVADGDRVAVEGELKDGDQVVVDGIDRLREGAKVAVIDSGAAARADEAAQDAGARRAAMMRNLTQEERDKLAKMTQEERRAFFRSKRNQPGAAGPAGAASGTVGGEAAAPAAGASAPAPGASRPASGRSAEGPRGAQDGAPRETPGPRADGGPRAEGGAPDGERRPGMSPEVRALLEKMSPEERQKLQAMAPDERRAYIRGKMQAAGVAAPGAAASR
ncbi:RND family efflux transporter, MFP subunit [Acidovorax sp. CF316]|uniref:MdtA/MuxA family multidrug efflux RND transporter periplasmic adaptor subunit n=1 Tax=Acidovorax sp. CF316 TaxID=1144317 RepID=UPI00026BCF4A|nr:MdtA/MuxA family multidrug efflux RND transporter periplasmic adaptor subunit [Acidovorax sp. CF316]EJE53032.1 RND family efflux transporter, MFP subunit [Acidovorax sp. CF316]